MRTVFSAALLVLMTSLAIAQNAAPTETGTVQGIVTRLGTTEPFSGVQIALEGAVNPQAMQAVLNSAAGAGIVVTPPQGATVAEVTQLLTNAAAARGLPIGPPVIQALVNNGVGKQ